MSSSESAENRMKTRNNRKRDSKMEQNEEAKRRTPSESEEFLETNNSQHDAFATYVPAINKIIQLAEDSKRYCEENGILLFEELENAGRAWENFYKMQKKCIEQTTELKKLQREMQKCTTYWSKIGKQHEQESEADEYFGFKDDISRIGGLVNELMKKRISVFTEEIKKKQKNLEQTVEHRNPSNRQLLEYLEEVNKATKQNI